MQVTLWWGLFWRTGGWWALILGAVCLGATAYSVYDYQLAVRFDREGVMVPVTVAPVWVTVTHTKHGTQRHYHGTLDYSVGTAHFHREEGLSEAEYFRFTSESVQQMRVLPASPTEIETTTGETLGTAHLVQWVALGLGLAALGVGYWIGQEAALMVLARRLGQVRTVAVARVVEDKRKGKPTGKGHLTWIGPAGQPMKSLTKDMVTLRDYPVGSRIEVFQRKDRSFWAGDVGERPAPTHDIPDVDRR